MIVTSRRRFAPLLLLVALLCGLPPGVVTAQSSSSSTAPPMPDAPARTATTSASAASASDAVLVIHGGAGTISRDNMTEEQEAAYRAALRTALETGYDVLNDGGSALDAVVATIKTMEDDPLFNAAKGAVFTSENTVELDASIMDGATRNAGALTGVKRIRNPIELARTIMEESPHVMMAQEGAETFAEENGFDFVDNSYFYTERRKRQAEDARGDAGGATPGDEVSPVDPINPEHKYGTVGALALDQDGNLAAGTSTGGMTNKRFGRVGDSPIIGAGTYADNRTCAVSSTGHGEYFIRAAVAHDIAARMRYGGMSVSEAATSVVMEELPNMEPDGGSGGVIALDADGNVAMPFNSEGMYRGFVDADGNVVVKIYGDE